MKTLIYEVFKSKRDGGEPYVNIYSDGSYKITIPDLSVPCDDPFREELRLSIINDINEKIEERLHPQSLSEMRRLSDWFDNPRYEDSYFTLKAVTKTIFPFPGFHIVYHGKGKPWVRVCSKNAVF